MSRAWTSRAWTSCAKIMCDDLIPKSWPNHFTRAETYRVHNAATHKCAVRHSRPGTALSIVHCALPCTCCHHQHGYALVISIPSVLVPRGISVSLSPSLSLSLFVCVCTWLSMSSNLSNHQLGSHVLRSVWSLNRRIWRSIKRCLGKPQEYRRGRCACHPGQQCPPQPFLPASMLRACGPPPNLS